MPHQSWYYMIHLNLRRQMFRVPTGGNSRRQERPDFRNKRIPQSIIKTRRVDPLQQSKRVHHTASRRRRIVLPPGDHASLSKNWKQP